MEKRLLRMPQLRAKYPRGKATIYREIQKGLFVEPIHLGPRCSAWPETEVDAIVAAHAAGASEDDIRKLVARLLAERRTTAKTTKRERIEAALRAGWPQEVVAAMECLIATQNRETTSR